MDPVTAGLFVAASFASSAYSSKQQARIDAANIKLNLEQHRLQTAEAAYERSKQFRENIASNLALSGIGMGGVSGFRGVATQSISDYFADRAALDAQDAFATASAYAGKAVSRANKFGRDAENIVNSAMLASQLGLFGVKGKKVR